MKRIKVLKLKQRLELVLTTIRTLTPEELQQVNGGGGGKVIVAGTGVNCSISCEFCFG